MNTTEALFARWIALKGYTSGREGAKALGLSHQAPTHWKAGHNAAAHIVERMATDLGEDPAKHLIQVFLETAKGKDVATLKRFAKRVGAAALAAVMMAGLSLPAPAQAVTGYTLCEARKRKRRKREPVTEPDIHPEIQRGIVYSRASCAARFFRPRDGTATLPQARSTHEQLRSFAVRVRDQRTHRFAGQLDRLAA